MGNGLADKSPIAETSTSGFFRFRIEGDKDNKYYTIPQSVTDGSDVVQFSSTWSETNIPGSTEPMVAFNYVNAPTVNVNLKFCEDMWREANFETTMENTYEEVISAFASMIYPDEQNGMIKPPYCIVNFGNGIIYRGYFKNIRINQYGVMRGGHKINCEISSTLHIMKRTAPRRKDFVPDSSYTGGYRDILSSTRSGLVPNGYKSFRVYFST